jgi:WD40 repeat protein
MVSYVKDSIHTPACLPVFYASRKSIVFSDRKVRLRSYLILICLVALPMFLCRAPTGPGSKNPDKKPLLATASFDGSVRLWNVTDGTCTQVFSRHRDSVYSVAFSPSGNYLASGSLAGQLYIWNVMEGRHIKSFKGKGDIFEVAWNKEETRVAACFSSNVVCILDFP